MSIQGLEYVYLETHDWAITQAFWTKFGYVLDLDLGHGGQLVNKADGSRLFFKEVPRDQPPSVQLYLRCDEEVELDGGSGWVDSHWETRLNEVIDPDGRTVVIQSPQGE